MADQKPENESAESKKTKRRFRAAPTLREQTEKQSGKVEGKPSRVRRFFGSKAFVPFHAIGRGIRKVWLSGPLRPVRFIARILGKVLVPQYFRNSWKELRQVTWPDFKTTWRLTFAVLVFGTVFGLAIYGLDILLEKGLREVLLG
ncbi:MAG TPA: preprotein translocase subunit SecE [Candidatus Saccharimonadales bacterium]|nr:preprotein translocase subunit SecE [Candidatus Saccharimonadales bacterium]